MVKSDKKLERQEDTDTLWAALRENDSAKRGDCEKTSSCTSVAKRSILGQNGYEWIHIRHREFSVQNKGTLKRKKPSGRNTIDEASLRTLSCQTEILLPHRPQVHRVIEQNHMQIRRRTFAKEPAT